MQISMFQSIIHRDPTIMHFDDLGVFLRSLGCQHVEEKYKAPAFSVFVEGRSQILVLDVDHANPEEVTTALSSLTFTYYTHDTFSASNQYGKSYLRVYIPLSRSVDEAEMKTLYRNVSEFFNIPSDKVCWGSRRVWFAPSTRTEKPSPALAVVVKTALTLREQVTQPLDVERYLCIFLAPQKAESSGLWAELEDDTLATSMCLVVADDDAAFAALVAW